MTSLPVHLHPINVIVCDDPKKSNLVGRVDVKDHYAFAAIPRKKAKQTLKLIQNEKIKGVKTLIELAK